MSKERSEVVTGVDEFKSERAAGALGFPGPLASECSCIRAKGAKTVEVLPAPLQAVKAVGCPH